MLYFGSMKFWLLIFAYCLLPAANCYSQLPDCDIWLLDIKDSAGHISFHNPINITNRKGYDNQPVFSPDGKYILYSSQRDSGGQTDIYKYDLKTKTTTQFTHTPTSEYSPAFMPDGKNISVVMVEKDSAQRLWKFPLSGDEPMCIMKNVDSIGYHCWINKDSVAIFVLTKPSSLQIVAINLQKPKIIAQDVARGLQMVKKYKLFYIQKSNNSNWRIKTSKLTDNSFKVDLPLYFKIEDFCFNDFLLREPSIIFCNGGSIYASGFWGNEISLLQDISSYGISNITRIAISPDGKKLAVVSNK